MATPFEKLAQSLEQLIHGWQRTNFPFFDEHDAGIRWICVDDYSC
ncbi:hypothetical protein [Aquipluma nitroreducens]|nr:hypothetical protein [Aquipluma nitroreducens]